MLITNGFGSLYFPQIKSPKIREIKWFAVIISMKADDKKPLNKWLKYQELING